MGDDGRFGLIRGLTGGGLEDTAAPPHEVTCADRVTDSPPPSVPVQSSALKILSASLFFFSAPTHCCGQNDHCLWVCQDMLVVDDSDTPAI